MAVLTVLGTLHKARELVHAGVCDGLFEAIGALRGEASGPVRDCAYFALMETAAAGDGVASFTTLARPGEAALTLLDATIVRLTAALH